MNLNDEAQRAHAINVANGFHEVPACEKRGTKHKTKRIVTRSAKRPKGGIETIGPAHPEGIDYNRVATYVALLHSEVSEALEELRKDGNDGKRTMQMYFAKDKNGLDKPEGFATELVDVIIRALDAGAALGLDLQGAYEAKLAYNRQRGYKHGGKNL